MDNNITLDPDLQAHKSVLKVLKNNGDDPKVAKEKVEAKLEEATILRQDRAARVVKLRDTLKTCRLKPGSRKEDDTKIVLRDGKYYQMWTNPCHKWMKRFMPEKEKPEDVYLSIR